MVLFVFHFLNWSEFANQNQFVLYFSYELIRIGRLKVLITEGHDTYKHFKKDKQTKQLSYNEEQIHRMDK